MRADLGNLASLTSLRTLNVSNQGYWQYCQFPSKYAHVLTGEWRRQSVVWLLGVHTDRVTVDAHSCGNVLY